VLVEKAQEIAPLLGRDGNVDLRASIRSRHRKRKELTKF